MSQLLDLPNEVLQEIIERVLPDDLENFVGVDKRLLTLATTVLQVHEAHKQEYHSYHCGSSETATAISDLLDLILIYPRVAYYIKVLTVDGWASSWHVLDDVEGSDEMEDSDVTEDLDDMGDSNDMEDPDDVENPNVDAIPSKLHLPYVEEKTGRIKTAAAELIPAAEFARWNQSISDGDEDPIIALLILLLPNLENLRLEMIRCPPHYLLRTIRQAMDPEKCPVALSRLVHAGVHIEIGLDRYGDISMNVPAALAGLPSMQSLQIRAICAQEWDPFAGDHLKPQQSNVQELTSGSSVLSAKSIFRFLGGFKSLKSFKYDDSYLEVNEDEPEDILHLIHCGSALLSLPTTRRACRSLHFCLVLRYRHGWVRSTLSRIFVSCIRKSKCCSDTETSVIHYRLPRLYQHPLKSFTCRILGRMTTRSSRKCCYPWLK